VIDLRRPYHKARETIVMANFQRSPRFATLALLACACSANISLGDKGDLSQPGTSSGGTTSTEATGGASVSTGGTSDSTKVSAQTTGGVEATGGTSNSGADNAQTTGGVEATGGTSNSGAANAQTTGGVEASGGTSNSGADNAQTTGGVEATGGTAPMGGSTSAGIGGDSGAGVGGTVFNVGGMNSGGMTVIGGAYATAGSTAVGGMSASGGSASTVVVAVCAPEIERPGSCEECLQTASPNGLCDQYKSCEAERGCLSVINAMAICMANKAIANEDIVPSGANAACRASTSGMSIGDTSPVGKAAQLFWDQIATGVCAYTCWAI